MTNMKLAGILPALILSAIAIMTASAEARTRHTIEIQEFDRHSLDGAGSIQAYAMPAASISRSPTAARRKHDRRYREAPPAPPSNVASLDPSIGVEQPQRVQRAGLIKIGTDDNGGGIVVDRSVSDRFEGFIADVRARGFKGRIHCHATGGHVRGSNHYWGGACDFAQRGWGKTVAVMYHVRDLASKWGLRDGCSFGDCGHIDAPRSRYARR